MCMGSHARENPHKRGFTLIEMLVALALFTMVITACLGSLLVLVDVNSQAQAVQRNINSIAFALDVMTRDIRTGDEYACASDWNHLTSGGAVITDAAVKADATNFPSEGNCRSGGVAMAYTRSFTGDRVAYRLHNERIERKVADGTWESLTSSTTRVSVLEFTITGVRDPALATNLNQPIVTIYIDAETGTTRDLDSRVQLETNIVQRKLDI